MKIQILHFPMVVVSLGSDQSGRTDASFLDPKMDVFLAGMAVNAAGAITVLMTFLQTVLVTGLRALGTSDPES